MIDKVKLQKEALRFLKEHYIMVVSSVSKDGVPHAATVYYIIADDEFNLFFVTDGDSIKANNLRAYPKVAFVIGVGPQASTLQGLGETTELTNKDEITKLQIQVLSMIDASAGHNWPAERLKHESLAGFMIKISKLTWLNLDNKGYPEAFAEEYQLVLP